MDRELRALPWAENSQYFGLKPVPPAFVRSLLPRLLQPLLEPEQIDLGVEVYSSDFIRSSSRCYRTSTGPL